MFRLPLAATLCALLLAGPAGAQIYSWTDADGNRIFSDQPRPGASTVELGPTNVIAPAPAAAQPRSSDPPTDSGNASFYRELNITSPAHDSNIRSNEGDLTLVVQTDPPLSGSHLLRVSLDGVLSDSAVPGNGAAMHQLTVRNVDRGSHQVAVVVVNARGEELQRSAPITVHLQRTSLNQPGRGGANQAPRAPAAPRAPNVPKPGTGG
ncbi:DUF4124 domain-containing protein [Halopseudomonas bauzanensis]|uniref:DUF4124 domain-containing protein n=1 Tax=Halopseudomonas bauzanensis TaxID=653930 RepID=A0A1I4LFY4_9GAMM|nr:DUF4124 domain-containing protein [Halopseudomonas bauzanensis]SER92049.1 protein of unknown function [Halopseudomonas bauzanensis]SFL89945.1 protein of unknown function [Halopseudomonas bauzanensis]